MLMDIGNWTNDRVIYCGGRWEGKSFASVFEWLFFC